LAEAWRHALAGAQISAAVASEQDAERALLTGLQKILDRAYQFV
jgi:hypothetical protein